MSDELYAAVDSYIVERLLPRDEAMEAALRNSATHGLRPINVAPNQGRFLFLLATAMRAQRVLEIGTLGGYSTLWLASALPAGGRVITLELESSNAEVARENLDRAGLQCPVEIRVGDARKSLAGLVAEGQAPFDLIFIDADKASIPEYVQWALKLSRAGSVLIVDNVVRRGRIIDPEDTDPNVQGLRRFYELLQGEPRLQATAIQTVGSKGHDGFAMAVVVEPAAIS